MARPAGVWRRGGRGFGADGDGATGAWRGMEGISSHDWTTRREEWQVDVDVDGMR